MDVKVIEETDDYIKFDLIDADVGMANLLRRFILTRVKAFAIDRITVYENTTQYFDEFIAHRLGLIPIKTPEKVEGSEQVVFTLDVIGPKKVYSGDLKFNDPEVKPVYDNIPLFDLAEGRSLRLEGVAVLGDMHRHAKFQSAFVHYNIDEKDDKLFHFYVETYHQLPVRTILARALDEIKKTYTEIDERLDEVFDKTEGG